MMANTTEYAAGPLEFVATQPTDMEIAEMVVRLLDHHARIHNEGIRSAIESILIKLANPLMGALRA